MTAVATCGTGLGWPWWAAVLLGLGVIVVGAGIGVALRYLVPYWAARRVARRWPQIIEEERRHGRL